MAAKLEFVRPGRRGSGDEVTFDMYYGVRRGASACGLAGGPASGLDYASGALRGNRPVAARTADGMISVVHPKKDEGNSETRILADVLYSDKVRIRTSEKEWLALVTSIAAGDQLALHSLYQQTYRIVFTLTFRITNNRETAEEVTLDVYYEIWRRASAYDPAGGPVVGWIMNLARSRAIDRLRFEHRKKRFNSDVDLPLTTAAADDPQRACQLEEQIRHLRDALGDLTAEERRLIETAFFSELTYAEVAAQLNQPVGTVKTRIRSGLGKLRHALSGRLGHQ